MLKKFFSLGLIFISFSCSSNLNNKIANTGIEYIRHNVKTVKNTLVKDIKLSISRKTFETKVGYSNAILPKKYNDIEYIKVFLVNETNYTNPFQSGANVFGDGVYKVFNKNLDFSNLTIDSVPIGNNYKAVVSAFDSNNLNITKENIDLLSLDKRWFLSSNTVSINENNVTYSSGNSLIVDLYLEDGEGAKVSSSISIRESEIDQEDIRQ
jgi:hypothetical protein